MTKEKKKIINLIDRYADVIINSPPMGHFHERPFVLWLLVGYPYHRDMHQEAETRNLHRGGVRILHAPSNPEAKGTPKIRRVIESLKLKGHDIEFIQIKGKSNSVVLRELTKCDFIIDQLFSSTPMATFATEAAFHGKPAGVGSYYAQYVHQDIPAKWIPPSLFCHPDKIEQAIEKMIVDEDYRLELGRKAKSFVEEYWTPEHVAQRYLQLIEDNIPNEWLYDPRKIRYLQGGCLSEVRAKKLVRAVIEKGGKQALQLCDKPELEQMFVAWAYNEAGL